MPKRTKILATIGPASATPSMVKDMIANGVNAFRINFSHGTKEQRKEYFTLIRSVEKKGHRPVAICADLCGPKIRIGEIEGDKIELKEGDTLILQRKPILGNKERVSTTLPELVDHVKEGEAILLADGRISLVVEEVHAPEEIKCRVTNGGNLSSGKGVNLPFTELEISSLTEKDREDVEWIAAHDFDYVALSFVRSSNDIRELRELLRKAGSQAMIIAKIEKPQALEKIEDIISAADAVMVARGDLGVEMDFPLVPTAQKRIAQLAMKYKKPCIVATEMMESMIHQPRPTRAEASDVANAVWDGADAVMLSAESAVGEYPLQVVQAMCRILMEAERFSARCIQSQESFSTSGNARYHALSGAIEQMLQHEKIAAVAAFTDSGRGALLLAKNRFSKPILAIARHHWAARRTCLYYGIFGRTIKIDSDSPQYRTKVLLEYSAAEAKLHELAQPGEQVLIVGRFPPERQGEPNGLAIIEIT